MSNIKRSFQEKLRTRSQLDEAYSKEALQLGHKTRLLKQLEQETNRLAEECEKHLETLMGICKEEVAPEPEKESPKTEDPAPVVEPQPVLEPQPEPLPPASPPELEPAEVVEPMIAEGGAA